MQQARAHICREADEYGVNEKEIERAEEVEDMPRGQSVARRAEGRHKGRGDGHAGNDVALAFRAEGDKACRAAAGGDEHVVDSRRGASQEFRLRIAQGRDEEVDHRRQHADERGHAEVAARTFKQLEVADAHGQPHANYGPHERRHEHRADNHRRGVYVQAERGDEYGENQHPQRGASEAHALTYFLDNLFFVLNGELEKLFGTRPQQFKLWHSCIYKYCTLRNTENLPKRRQAASLLNI